MSLLVISHHFIIFTININYSFSKNAKLFHPLSRSRVHVHVIVNVAVSIVDTNAANTPFAEATVS